MRDHNRAKVEALFRTYGFSEEQIAAAIQAQEKLERQRQSGPASELRAVPELVGRVIEIIRRGSKKAA